MTMTLSGTSGGIGVIGSGTAVASTSGTSIDFTGLPAGLKRITVMFSGVSTSGSSPVIFQLGTSGGIQTTGYASNGSYNGPSNGGAGSTAGFITAYDSAARDPSGSIVFTLLNSATGTWSAMGIFAPAAIAGYTYLTAGGKTLSGALDRVRITTVGGTDTFDAGSINILYE